jgi:hypothetical protein
MVRHLERPYDSVKALENQEGHAIYTASGLMHSFLAQPAADAGAVAQHDDVGSLQS